MEKTELYAFEVNQDGTTFYVAPLRVKMLAQANFSKPDAWTGTNRDGYQRVPLQTRFKKIADYVLGRESYPPMLPQPIILNSRHHLTFKHATDDELGFGVLKLTEHDFPLMEVDGQHRLGGLRKAYEENPSKVGDYTIPVVIGNDIDRVGEALLFYLINTTQKRVPTDLAQRLIAQQMQDSRLRDAVVTQGKQWVAVGTQVVDALLLIPDNPWIGNLGIPGMAQKVIMRQVSFVDSLKPLLEGMSYKDESPAETAQIVANYWNAIRELCPSPFADPKEHVIQKTTGVFALHDILPGIIRRIERAGKRPTQGGFAAVLKQMDVWNDPEFWHREGAAGMYTGQKGFRLLADRLREQLPEPYGRKDA